MFTSADTEKLQLQKIFLTGRPEIQDPLFMDLRSFLNTMDVDPAWITFNVREQKLNIYLNDVESFGVDEGILQENISDDYSGLEISNKWSELAANHNYLSEISDHVEVLIKNFTKNYLIFLTDSCAGEILSSMHASNMQVKPVHIYCGTSASYTIIYKNIEDYDRAILTKSVFDLMHLIDKVIISKDTLALYRPHTIRLEILHLDIMQSDFIE